MRVDDELERPAVVASRHLGVADGVIVARLPGDESRESLTASLDQIEPRVLVDRGVGVRCRCRIEKAAHRVDVSPIHVALDLYPDHDCRVAVPSVF
jgi:hypothetical protein